jgi:hypothetical protein
VTPWRLVVDGAAFAVAHQHVLASELAEELAGDVPGVGAGVELRQVLRTVGDVKVITLDKRLNAAKVRERREDSHFNAAVVVVGVGQGPGQLLQQGDALDVVHVHLPVARDQWCAVEGAVS